jgi:hypothetical protein
LEALRDTLALAAGDTLAVGDREAVAAGDGDSDTVAAADGEPDVEADAAAEPLVLGLSEAAAETDADKLRLAVALRLAEREAVAVRDGERLPVAARDAERLPDLVRVSDADSDALTEALAGKLADAVRDADTEADTDTDSPAEIERVAEGGLDADRLVLRETLGDTDVDGDREPRKMLTARSMLLPASVA